MSQASFSTPHLLVSRFLVDMHWFKQASTYLTGESANPGPIDNKPLWKEDGSDIRDHMIDEMDYVLVPEEAWDMLVAEFGLEDNLDSTNTAVRRYEHGMFVRQLKVRIELWPFSPHDFVQGRSVLGGVAACRKFQLGGAKEEEVQQI